MKSISKSDLAYLYCQKGLSAAKIAKQFQCGYSTVIRRLYDYGIPVRKPGPHTGQRNPSWKGGRILDKYGYILLRMPNHPDAGSLGYVREHRFVMEQVLGRRLNPKELIHHKNGNRQDNRASNLEIVDPSNHRIIHNTVPMPPGHVMKMWYTVEQLTLVQIAERVGCHYTTVAANLKRLGVKMRKSNDLRMVQFPPNLVERYQSQSLRELAASIGCSVAAVRDALARRGAKIRHTGQRRGAGGVLPPP